MRLVAIVGTWKSGKTTVVERLVGRLASHGHVVGTLKLIESESFTIHPEGRDTSRHWDAGAHVSIALAPNETTVVRRTGGSHEDLGGVMDLVPPGVDVLVCEGLLTGGPDVRTVVCAKSPDQVAPLLRELHPDSHPVAVSGMVAASVEEAAGLPALNVLEEEGLDRLVDLVTGE